MAIKAVGAAAGQPGAALTGIGLIRTGLGPKGVATLALSLVGSKTLTRLDLEGNSAGDLGAKAISRLVTGGGSALEGLAIPSNRLGDDAAVSLFKAIRSNTAMRELYLW